VSPTPQDFELRVEHGGEPSTVTVEVLGELDLVTAPDFESRLAGLCEQGARQLTINLGSLSFIDSSGLSALVSTLRRYRSEGGDVVLRSPNRATAKVLEISGLNQVFSIQDDTEASA
jgi:anti-sigma B factor antagonist